MFGSKPHDFKQFAVPVSVFTPQSRKSDSYSTNYLEFSNIKITFVLTSKTVNKMDEKWYLRGQSKLILLLTSGCFLRDVSCE